MVGMVVSYKDGYNRIGGERFGLFDNRVCVSDEKRWIDNDGCFGADDDAGDRREPCLGRDVAVDFEGTQKTPW